MIFEIGKLPQAAVRIADDARRLESLGVIVVYFSCMISTLDYIYRTLQLHLLYYICSAFSHALKVNQWLCKQLVHLFFSCVYPDKGNSQQMGCLRG